MSMPMYVSPEQVMKDRADYARKGIARGRSAVAAVYDKGIVLCAENPSATLRKVSEIYDRIAFAGVGKYNEFDTLRIAGVRQADLRGYSYSREDVDARSLANWYAQILGQVFTHEMKPMEVEILVAEVGPGPQQHQMFHILYDGTVVDETDFTVLGGKADELAERLAEQWSSGRSLDETLRGVVEALAGPERTLTATDLEVATLAVGDDRRCFRRLEPAEVEAVLAG
jgi:proteasome alpha subunit